ncbi:hypothetical protein PIB30_007387 [Stylosanthes scabra]|uniref:Uncharacterized protein n=1 Tax=Stylosanthes scabra TaxID=79078 RepID=A0ABU6Z1M5_9FABA|nr:hypothetical protein [Stylosanthes scabra]
MTRSETLVRVERKSKRKNDSVPAPVPVQGVHDPNSEKRKNVEGHRIQSRRTRNRRSSPTYSNAESANQFLQDDEELHQQQHNQPPEEEGRQPQPPPKQPQAQQPPQEEVPQKQQQQQQQHQDKIIDISSGFELEPEPERETEPIPLRVLVPKVEVDLVASPREMLLTDTLLRLRNDEQPNKEDDNGPALQQQQEEEPQQQQQEQQGEEEEGQQQQQQQKEEQPSQSIVEVVYVFLSEMFILISASTTLVNSLRFFIFISVSSIHQNPFRLMCSHAIPATQEVIEINSDEEDPQPRPIKMLIPKVEKCVVSSPASTLITNVLMSMAEDTAIEPQHEEESQPDPSMPSFSLNLDNPTPQADEQPPPPKALEVEEEFPLIARTMAVIKSLDEQVMMRFLTIISCLKRYPHQHFFHIFASD